MKLTVKSFSVARVRQSALATLAGWAAGSVVGGFVAYSPLAFFYMAGHVALTWLLFVLPHALLLPRGHALLRPIWTWAYGALWGIGALLFFRAIGFHGNFDRLFIYALQTSNFYLFVAGVTGAVTTLTAGLLERNANSNLYSAEDQ
jgi:hypothetical protein